MDATGIPKKINRNVLKAIHYYTLRKNQIKGPITFRKILDFVRTRNGKGCPVSNLEHTVSSALVNLEKLGIIEKGSGSTFTLTKPRKNNNRSGLNKKSKYCNCCQLKFVDNTHFPADIGSIRVHDDDSDIEEIIPETTVNIYRGQKQLKFEGNNVPLHKVTRCYNETPFNSIEPEETSIENLGNKVNISNDEASDDNSKQTDSGCEGSESSENNINISDDEASENKTKQTDSEYEGSDELSQGTNNSKPESDEGSTKFNYIQ